MLLCGLEHLIIFKKSVILLIYILFGLRLFLCGRINKRPPHAYVEQDLLIKTPLCDSWEAFFQYANPVSSFIIYLILIFKSLGKQAQ